MFKIPNIYAGDYKKLIIFPILLILVSMFFIPSVPLGIDFRGGILLSIPTDSHVLDSDVSSSLLSAGFSDASVKVSPNPLGGKTVEVEIPLTDEQSVLEAAKLEFDAKIVELDELNAQQAFFSQKKNDGTLTEQEKTESDELAKKILEKRAELDFSADKIFSLVGKHAKEFKSSTDLSEAFTESYGQASSEFKQKIVSALSQSFEFDESSVSFKSVSPALSKSFIEKATNIVVVATILSAIVVFLVFRSLIPSIAVISGAAADIAIALGAMGLFGIPLTLPSFAALLMLIGFSLDTDVLLTMRVLKRKEGTARQRAYETMLTGSTMSLAALTAFTILFIIANITNIPTYYQIGAVAVFGLLGDLVATWMFNAVILLWHVESKEKKEAIEHKRPGLQLRV